ncbi:hypothetical protein M422DRAFT_274348 [Sphaerobolus stellatus SS14]|uniref:DUF6532 domain-containing protein n=1 Tax=Sphaerobolus stellatus (strain SS14) TaxID=990650 RepID=A0A0C9UHA9_SPHS4|nr:hypothetical protein M422DRAFT_274348 [Sphaerobolus stellatus SS14]
MRPVTRSSVNSIGKKTVAAANNRTKAKKGSANPPRKAGSRSKSADTAPTQLLPSPLNLPPGVGGLSITPEVEDALREETDPYFQTVPVKEDILFSDDINEDTNSTVKASIEPVQSYTLKDVPYPYTHVPASGLLQPPIGSQQELSQPLPQDGDTGNGTAKRKSLVSTLSPTAKKSKTTKINTPAALIQAFEERRRHEEGLTHAVQISPSTSTMTQSPTLSPIESPAVPPSTFPADTSNLHPIPTVQSDVSATPSPNAIPVARSIEPAPPTLQLATQTSAERDPTFYNGKILTSASSPNTKLIINEASIRYKLKIVTKHAFPETVNLKTSFAQQAWAEAHASKPPKDGMTLKFSEKIENLIHSNGGSFRGSAASKLSALAAAAYNIPLPITEVSKAMVEELTSDGNLTWRAVQFDEKGKIRRLANDPDTLLRLKPMFGHPFLVEVLKQVVFNPANRPPVRGRLQISAWNLSVRNYPPRQAPSGSDSVRDSPSTHSSTPMAGEWEVWLETMVAWWRIYAHIVIAHEAELDPLPSEAVAFACTVAHCGLRNLVKEKREDFSGEVYSPIYSDYRDLLQDFERESPNEYEEVLAAMLNRARTNLGHVQGPVRSGRRSRTGGLSSLSEEAFNVELRIHGTTTTPPSHVPIPTTMTIAAVVGSHGSVAAAHGHVTQNAPPFATYGMPFQAPYMYSSGPQPTMQYTMPQPSHPSQQFPQNPSQ